MNELTFFNDDCLNEEEEEEKQHQKSFILHKLLTEGGGEWLHIVPDGDVEPAIVRVDRVPQTPTSRCYIVPQVSSHPFFLSILNQYSLDFWLI